MDRESYTPAYRDPEVWEAIAERHGPTWARVGREVMSWPDDGRGMPTFPDDRWAAIDRIMDCFDDVILSDSCSIFDALSDRIAELITSVTADRRG